MRTVTELVRHFRTQKSIDRSADLTYLSRLGTGAFGEVWKCRWSSGDDTSLYACKIIKKTLAADDAALVANEIATWRRLAHPNLLTLVELVETPRAFHCVTDLMEDSLHQIHQRMLRLGSKPRILTTLNRLVQVGEAMVYLHEHRILHRDIKSHNVLCSGDRSVLSDFGLSKTLADCMTGETGSYRWMAPEVVRHEKYDEGCDVYSFSMLTYEMLTLRVPFQNFTPIETAMAVARGERPTLPPVPKYMQTLVEDCWQQDSTARPRFNEIVPRIRKLRAQKESFGSLEMAGREVREHILPTV